MAVKITYAGKGYEENDELGQALLEQYEPIILVKLEPLESEILEWGGTLSININKQINTIELDTADPIFEELKARIHDALYEEVEEVSEQMLTTMN